MDMPLEGKNVSAEGSLKMMRFIEDTMRLSISYPLPPNTTYHKMKGGMQTSGISSMYCLCGKTTSKTIELHNGVQISIHFGKKKTYWHINGQKRTFIMPEEWK